VLNWVEIDARALRGNLESFRSHLEPGALLGSVVKANAYGHGLLEVAGIAAGAGADWLCVNSVGEAVRLRQAGRSEPLLVMGYVALQDLPTVVELDLRPVVYGRETIDRLAGLATAAGKTVPLHLKLETGTYRQGVDEQEAVALADRIGEAGGVSLEGVCTHFANIEDTTDHSFAERQIERFSLIHRRLSDLLGRSPMRHAACSAATLLFARTHLDLVRLGISMYGHWPSKETRVSCRDRGKPTPELTPSLTWKTRVAQVKDVPEGSFVGYGCTFRTTRPSRIAVLPVGYYDGYDRKLSGVAHVLIRGRRAPVRGRVCMNMCMVDVTDIDRVAVEDEVVLLGAQGEERIPAEQVAAWAGSIAYEVLARIHPDLPRVVVEGTGSA
jgi:alanine racemase